jgi:hypothetical protein
MTILLINQANQARWYTGRLVDANNTAETAQIPFQGSDADPRGFVRVDDTQMEDGKTYKALRAHPKWVNNGTIKGFFPWVTLPQNAVFEASTGFVNGAANTDGVHFQAWVHYLESGQERWYRIGSQIKNYSGSLGRWRCDLSKFSGQNVSLELRCDAVNTSSQDWAAWINPQIVSNQTVGDVPLSVKLDRFSCYNADEDSWYSNGDEPYLFVFVIVIDGYGINLANLNQAKVRIYSAPRTHRNLNKTHVHQGQNFPIPVDTGSFEFWLKPVQPIQDILPLSKAKSITQVGIAVIAMEEDATPTSTINNARKQIQAQLQSKLDQLLRSKIQAALVGGNTEVSSAEINEIVGAVKNSVINTIKKETLSSLNIFAMADPDDYVGSNYGLWSYSQIEDAAWKGIPLNWNFQASGVRYGISGKIAIG